MLTGMGYNVDVFIQGVGWRKLGVFKCFDEALDTGATAVVRDYKTDPERHGSRVGDVVGFRVTLSDSQPESLPDRSVRWRDVSHRFFRRGNAYFLYKTWSWPD